ncbi:GroES-like protein [Hysterangium stoloniferum]|nr:GroES-like protein [Hysterangium stoloniferum]
MSMKAVVYKKPFEVAIEDVKKPKIQHPDDIVDLHMYEGRTKAESGIVFGHENMGIVEEVGDAVSFLKKGDRVVLPLNVACGRCRNCEEGQTGFCTQVNPGFAGGAYGYVSMGPYQGGQAQYLRVPFADLYESFHFISMLKLPPGRDNEADFICLADSFPTARFTPGETIAIFGAGPVGLMAAYSAILRGASAVYVVDRVQERLNKVKAIGYPVDQIIKMNGGEVDRAVDAVGYQAISSDGKKEEPNIIINSSIRVTRPTGGLGIPGFYVHADPGAPDHNSAKGLITLPFGMLFQKGLSLGTGQCNVKMYNRHLRDLIICGRAKPSFMVSHEIGLNETPTAYKKFDDREEGYTKVLIHPNGW